MTAAGHRGGWRETLSRLGKGFPARLSVLLLVSAWGLLANSVQPNLVDPDEPRSALVMRLMAERGDWLVPRLPVVFHHDYPHNPVEGNTFVYWDKPPLFFWLGAAAMKVLGPASFAARLPSALAYMAMVLLVYRVARWLWDPEIGVVAGLVAGLAPLAMVMAHVARMEALLAMLTTAMLLGVVKLWSGVGRAWLWTLVLYGAAGLGILTKGPVAVILPAAAVLLTVVLSRRWGDLARLRPLPGLMLMLAIASPWFIYMHLRYPAGADGAPGFSHAFFISQHLARAATSAYGHGGWFPGYLLGVLLVGFLPWTVFLPEACYRLFRKGWHDRRGQPAILLVFAWAAVTVGAYSLSRSQMPHYVLPAFPALAVLIGGYVGGRLRLPQPSRLFAVGLGVSIAGAWSVLAVVAGVLTYVDRWDWVGIVEIAVAAGLLGGASFSLVRRQWTLSLGVLMLALMGLSLFVIDADPTGVHRFLTARTEAHKIEREIRPGDRIISYPYTPYSLAWYLWPRETTNPPNEGALAEEVNRPVRTFCVFTKKAVWPRLQPKMRQPTRVLSEPPHLYVVVSEPAAEAAPDAP